MGGVVFVCVCRLLLSWGGGVLAAAGWAATTACVRDDSLRGVWCGAACGRCTILNYSKAYARMIAKHPELESIVELVEEPYSTYSAGGGFDLVHTCVWRGQFEAQPIRSELEAKLLSFTKPGGTVVVIVNVSGRCGAGVQGCRRGGGSGGRVCCSCHGAGGVVCSGGWG